MYIVVSRWKARPGKDREFAEVSNKMRGHMRSVPGIELLESFVAEGCRVVIVGYTDQGAYQRAMAEDGPFARAARENRLEEIGEWLGSDRGESDPH